MYNIYEKTNTPVVVVKRLYLHPACAESDSRLYSNYLTPRVITTR